MHCHADGGSSRRCLPLRASCPRSRTPSSRARRRSRSRSTAPAACGSRRSSKSGRCRPGAAAGHVPARRHDHRHHRRGHGRQGFGGSAQERVGDQVGRAALRPGHRHGRCVRQCQDHQQRQYVRRPGSAHERGSERRLHDERRSTASTCRADRAAPSASTCSTTSRRASITAPTRRARARPIRRGTSRARRSISTPAQTKASRITACCSSRACRSFASPWLSFPLSGERRSGLLAADVLAQFDDRLRSDRFRITSTSRRIAT